MSRAIIKNKHKKNLGRSALLDKKINTKLEKRIQQIAKAEDEKNKKQKCHMRVLFGRFQAPVISADSAVGQDDKYDEAAIIAPQYVTKDFLKDTAGTPLPGGGSTVKRSIFAFPQIRMTPEVQPGGDLVNYKKYGTNPDIVFSDYDEIGHTRSSSEIMLKGFRLAGEIHKNVVNKDDEVEISLAVYRVNAEYSMDQRTAQYILPSSNQAQACPKRLIKEFLGSDINTNQPLVPDTEQIKQRVLFKQWNLRPRQELYLANDAANLRYNERKINFNLYCETNQKIEYARGPMVPTGGMKNSTQPINANVISNTEIIDSFEGTKYICVVKSTVPVVNQALHAPQMTLGLTCYWTDVTA